MSIADYGPELSIPSHYHEWACVSVLLHGRFEQRFPGKWCDCPPGVVLAKPPGERHEDRWHAGWSRHLIIEVDPARHEELGPLRPVAEEVVHVGDVGAETIAWAAWRELSHSDSLTPIGVEGLVLQLLTRLRRRAIGEPRSRAAPPWMGIAMDYIHAHFRTALRLREVAAVAGVHPDHLARVFGSIHSVTIGEYVRRLRVEAAAVWLSTGDDDISVIAFRSGFSDQSHLNRVFKRMMGVTPGRYRTLERVARGVTTTSRDATGGAGASGIAPSGATPGGDFPNGDDA